MNVLFREEQKFTYWWLWTLLILITLIPVYGLYIQVVRGIPFGDKPMSDMGLILFFILMLVMNMLTWQIKLTTQITDQNIDIHYFPFFKKRFQIKEIDSLELVKYGFVGYGVRIGTQHGTVYNVAGNKGLALVLRNKRKYCIGTQKPDELQNILTHLSK